MRHTRRNAAPDTRRPTLNTRLALVVTAFIWGTTFPVTRAALAHTDPTTLMTVRMSIGALPFLAMVWRNRDFRTMLAGAELGLWMWAALTTQTVGLTTTTAGRSAFITALSVILVALGDGLFLHHVRRQIWVGVVLAVTGIAVLTYRGTVPDGGDAWTFLCAVLYAGLILRMCVHARRVAVLPFVAWQLTTAALASVLWAVLSGARTGPIVTAGHEAWLAGMYLGLAATLLTTYLQSYGQRYVPATEAGIIYSLEPVWALILGCLFLSEPFEPTGVVGGLLVVLACAVCQLPDRPAAG